METLVASSAQSDWSKQAGRSSDVIGEVGALTIKTCTYGNIIFRITILLADIKCIVNTRRFIVILL